MPHYTNEPFKDLAEEIFLDLKDKIKLVQVSNTLAIEVKGDNVRIVGSK